jgi:hypothetical protein
VKFDTKSLFPYFRVFGQGAVGETESFHRAAFINQVHNPARVQGPESEMRHQNGDRRAHFDPCAGPAETQPRHLKHLPLPNALIAPSKTCRPFPK